MADLIIAGVTVPHIAGLELTQTYSGLQGSERLRTMDGTAIQQTRWNGKLATTIRGSGWMPAELGAIDWAVPVELRCIAPRAVASQSNVIALPAARRSDEEPIGYALTGSGWVQTGIAVASDVATLVAVAGATAYRVHYLPQLQVFANPVSESGDLAGGNFGWSLEAESV